MFRSMLAVAASLFLLASSAQADNLDYSMTCPSTGGASVSNTVRVYDTPTSGTIYFGQVTIEYDSTEVAYASASGLNSVYGLYVNETPSVTLEVGNKAVLIQWQHAGFTSAMDILSVTWDKVSCGSATLHFNDNSVPGNPPTHALTTNPNAIFGSYYENMTTYDGCVTFTCGGGGGELDKPAAPETWARVKNLFK